MKKLYVLLLLLALIMANGVGMAATEKTIEKSNRIYSGSTDSLHDGSYQYYPG